MKIHKALSGLLLLCAVGAALAGPKPDQVDRLGADLTPMGSPTAGNEAGTIPEWTGGIQQPPPGYEEGDHHPNPFPDEEIRFVIDSSNYQEYADQLSPGQEAMFERYPESYRMNVYSTRRSASFPQRTYEMTAENGKTARLVADGEGIENAAEGFPFPFPEHPKELIWNHKLKYKGTGGVRWNNQAPLTEGGSYSLVKIQEEFLGLYYNEGETIESIDNILLYFFQEVTEPARLAGNILLVHETLNQVKQPRQAWVYNPGQRRVRRAPNVAYDNPGTAADNLRTSDQFDMFNGATDRYNWEIVGKKEMYVPYNSYQVHSSELTPDDILGDNHTNQDLLRYELHRVWVVEANLKEGTRHIYPRRVFYIDEDSYQILLVDCYDARGELWRFQEGHPINYYEVPTLWTTLELVYDLQSGRYLAMGLDNQDDVNTFDEDLSPANYNPQALRRRGRR